MSYRADNAVILAAGTSSRFAPLSYERPKALIQVKGEVLLERQIRQLQEAGIRQIIVVTGYKKEQFDYLREKQGVILVENREYRTRNNHSSIYAVRDCLKNTYICSADNYFTGNPFEAEVEAPYYAAVYADGETKEWCMQTDCEGYVNDIRIGGSHAWYMLGHAFWDEAFSRRFTEILEAEYMRPETEDLLWEAIYMRHLPELKLKLRKYDADFIFEFDSLDELRGFDPSYLEDTRSKILKRIAAQMKCSQAELTGFRSIREPHGTEAAGFSFVCRAETYMYWYETGSWRKVQEKGKTGQNVPDGIGIL